MDLQTWKKDVLHKMDICLQGMPPAKAARANHWTGKFSMSLYRFPPELREQWVPILTDILDSVKDEHEIMLEDVVLAGTSHASDSRPVFRVWRLPTDT